MIVKFCNLPGLLPYFRACSGMPVKAGFTKISVEAIWYPIPACRYRLRYAGIERGMIHVLS